MTPAPATSSRQPSFDISPQVVFRLGDELITDELQALIELVKNSYDASATKSSVVINTEAPAMAPDSPGPSPTADKSAADEAGPEIEDEATDDSKTSQPIGWIEVRDNGDGMTREGLERGWLLISSSQKRTQKAQGKKNRLGRTPLGDKGLGRLGVLRLGAQVEIRTRPRDAAEEHILRFSRSDFERESALSDINLHYDAKSLIEHDGTWQIETPFANDVGCTTLDTRQGTTIRITGLISPEVWRDHQGVQERMTALLSPFSEIEQFTLDLTIDDEPVPLANIAAQRLDLANVRWTLDFKGDRIHLHGRLKLRAFEPASSNERLTRLWSEMVAPDEGRSFARRLISGPLSGVDAKPTDAPYWLSLSIETHLSDIPDPTVRRTKSRASQGDTNRPSWKSPGPFNGEIDSFDLAADAERSVAGATMFASANEYRDWVRQVRGIRVFRDGFGVRVGDDFLRLGTGFTSARGFYALRPGNIVGYIALSADGNAGLQETTDREGFVVNAEYRAFEALLGWSVERINYLQNQIGRELSKWADEAALPEPARPSHTAAELATQTAAQAARTTQALATVDAVQRTLAELGDGGALLTPDQEQAARKAADALRKLDGLAAEWDSLHARLNDLAARSREVETEREQLRDQLRVAYQTVGLGIVAETVAHEMDNITGRLQSQAKQLSPSFRGPEHAIARALVAEVNKSVRDIRQQIRHLEPQLRYQRAKRDVLNVDELVERVVEYHRPRLAGSGINVSVSGTPFAVRANAGRLQQALDNLMINSEFWLRHAGTANPRIDITLDPPALLFHDNGPGVDPVLAPAIFEPFVSGRSGEQGRGLGLFVTRQVLQDDQGSIFLGEADDDGAKRTFVLDLHDAVPEGAST